VRIVNMVKIGNLEGRIIDVGTRYTGPNGHKPALVTGNIEVDCLSSTSTVQ